MPLNGPTVASRPLAILLKAFAVNAYNRRTDHVVLAPALPRARQSFVRASRLVATRVMRRCRAHDACRVMLAAPRAPRPTRARRWSCVRQTCYSDMVSGGARRVEGGRDGGRCRSWGDVYPGY